MGYVTQQPEVINNQSLIFKYLFLLQKVSEEGWSVKGYYVSIYELIFVLFSV